MRRRGARLSSARVVVFIRILSSLFLFFLSFFFSSHCIEGLLLVVCLLLARLLTCLPSHLEDASIDGISGGCCVANSSYPPGIAEIGWDFLVLTGLDSSRWSGCLGIHCGVRRDHHWRVQSSPADASVVWALSSCPLMETRGTAASYGLGPPAEQVVVVLDGCACSL